MAVKLKLDRSGIAQPILNKPKKIASLPQSMLDEIFSYLTPIDLQNVSYVNKKLKINILQAVKSSVRLSIQRFIQNQIDDAQGEKFPNQRELLGNMAPLLNMLQGCANLLSAKVYILALRRRLIGLIAMDELRLPVDRQNLTRLPKLMENVFILSKLEKEIAEVNKIQNTYDREDRLSQICLALIRAGNLERAIRIAMSIGTESLKDSAFQSIAKALLHAGNIERAFGFAASIDINHIRDSVFYNICNALLQIKDVENARAAAKSISGEYIRDDSFNEICRHLLTECKFEQAVAVAKLISGTFIREYAFRYILEAVIKAGPVKRAVAVAMSIPEQSARSSALREISNKLLEAGHTKKAVAVAMSIPEQYYRSHALGEICRVFMQSGNAEKAVAVAMSIPIEDRDRILGDGCLILLQSGYVKEALRIAGTLFTRKSWKDRNCVSRFFCSFTRAGNLSEAITFAKSISAREIREEALSAIVQTSIEYRDYKRASVIALSIPRRAATDFFRNSIVPYFQVLPVIMSLVKEAVTKSAYKAQETYRN